jgi:hypothetical protein
MDIDAFWTLVYRARGAAGIDGEARVAGLRSLLAPFPAEQIESFDAHYRTQLARAYRWDLRAAAHLMNGGTSSDDDFLFFRDWLISEGQFAFERALENPDSLASAAPRPLFRLAAYGAVAFTRYKEKTGHDLAPDPAPPTEPSGPRWTENDLPRLLPRLASRYSQRSTT